MNLSHKEIVDVSVDQCIEDTYQMNETFTKERTEKVRCFFKTDFYLISLKFTNYILFL